MGKASRDKGARYERLWARCLRDNGFPGAERGRDNGFSSGDRAAQDQYDTKGVEGIWFDMKAGYGTASPEQETRWLIKVDNDAQANGRIGILVRNRAGKGNPLDWWAHLLASTYYELACAANFTQPGPSHPLPVLNAPVRVRTEDLLLLLLSAGYGRGLAADQFLPPTTMSRQLVRGSGLEKTS